MEYSNVCQSEYFLCEGQNTKPVPSLPIKSPELSVQVEEEDRGLISLINMSNQPYENTCFSDRQEDVHFGDSVANKSDVL